MNYIVHDFFKNSIKTMNYIHAFFQKIDQNHEL